MGTQHGDPYRARRKVSWKPRGDHEIDEPRAGYPSNSSFDSLHLHPRVPDPRRESRSYRGGSGAADLRPTPSSDPRGKDRGFLGLRSYAPAGCYRLQAGAHDHPRAGARICHRSTLRFFLYTLIPWLRRPHVGHNSISLNVPVSSLPAALQNRSRMSSSMVK